MPQIAIYITVVVSIFISLRILYEIKIIGIRLTKLERQNEEIKAMVLGCLQKLDELLKLKL